MTTYHPAYPTPPLTPVRVAFTGTRDELRGGEYLGGTARPELFEPGDIIAFTNEGYFYDPLMMITDSHTYVSVKNPGNRYNITKTWLRVDRDYLPYSFKFAQADVRARS